MVLPLTAVTLSLKVMVRSVLTATPVASSAGVVEIIIDALVSTVSVVKFQAVLPVIPLAGLAELSSNAPESIST